MNIRTGADNRMNQKRKITDAQLARIKKPSKLLEIALTDFNRVRRRKNVEIDMYTWLSRDTDDVCYLCLAGSVMIGFKGDDYYHYYRPYDFKSSRQLEAIDWLRTGRVYDACDSLGINLPDFNLNREIPEWKPKKPQMFLRAIRKLQKDLEKAGY